MNAAKYLLKLLVRYVTYRGPMSVLAHIVVIYKYYRIIIFNIQDNSLCMYTYCIYTYFHFTNLNGIN